MKTENKESLNQSELGNEFKTDVSDSTFYEYGAMSSKFKLSAKNKLTAYATIILHYQQSAHLVVIYSPEECKEDCWQSFTGQISERLDEIFGGKDSFDKYLEKNIEEVKLCYKTVKRLV